MRYGACNIILTQHPQFVWNNDDFANRFSACGFSYFLGSKHHLLELCFCQILTDSDLVAQFPVDLDDNFHFILREKFITPFWPWLFARQAQVKLLLI